MSQTSVILLFSLTLASNLSRLSKNCSCLTICSVKRYLEMCLMLLMSPSSLIWGMLPAFSRASSAFGMRSGNILKESLSILLTIFLLLT